MFVNSKVEKTPWYDPFISNADWLTDIYNVKTATWPLYFYWKIFDKGYHKIDNYNCINDDRILRDN